MKSTLPISLSDPSAPNMCTVVKSEIIAPPLFINNSRFPYFQLLHLFPFHLYSKWPLHNCLFYYFSHFLPPHLYYLSTTSFHFFPLIIFISFVIFHQFYNIHSLSFIHRQLWNHRTRAELSIAIHLLCWQIRSGISFAIYYIYLPQTRLWRPLKTWY